MSDLQTAYNLTEERENAVFAAQASFANAFLDTLGRIRRENPSALEAALNGGNPLSAKKAPTRRPRMALGDFKRDLLGENVLIGKRWGVRGNVVMIVSSTGTGKSVIQTQMAAFFTLGIPCCGLSPMRCFDSWIIQSEDDEDRVAIDRDDIFAEMEELYPSVDFEIPRRHVTFVDFTSYTGAKFLHELEKELALTPEEERPACIFINPMNAYFGGSLKEGSDCSAFFKGGQINGKDTDGLEAIAKRYNVLVIIFGHTPKPPMPKELRDWTEDPNICYKMCGASEIADAVRSILVFLPVPDSDGLFVFNAGKNGYTLGWTDPRGNKTTKSYWRWASSGRHFWEEVPKDEWPDAAIGKAVSEKSESDDAVRIVLSHMDAPGVNRTSVDKSAKDWGLKKFSARNAFYEIVRNRDKYGVISNIVQSENGRPTTLYHRIEPSAMPQTQAQPQPQPQQAQQQEQPKEPEEVQILTEEIQI